MRSRGLVVAIAVVLAVLAAVGVIVYTSSVREKAVDENTTPVLASTQDIQANTPLDPLIAQGVFQTIQVQNDRRRAGRGHRCLTAPGPDGDRPHLPERADPPGSDLGDQRREHPGDRSRQYRDRARGARSGSGQRFRPAGELRDDLCDVPAGDVWFRRTSSSCPHSCSRPSAGTGSSRTQAFVVPKDFTIPLVPAVEVLAVQNPPVDSSTGRTSKARPPTSST